MDAEGVNFAVNDKGGFYIRGRRLTVELSRDEQRRQKEKWAREQQRREEEWARERRQKEEWARERRQKEEWARKRRQKEEWARADRCPYPPTRSRERSSSRSRERSSSRSRARVHLSRSSYSPSRYTGITPSAREPQSPPPSMSGAKRQSSPFANTEERKKTRRQGERPASSRDWPVGEEVEDIPFNRHHGIDTNRPHLERHHLVEALYDKATRSERCAHIAAPPAWGKTSLLQLFARRYRNDGHVCIHISLGGALSAQKQLLKDAGIDLAHQMLNTDMENVVWDCVNDGKFVFILLDECHGKYSETTFWNSLIKDDAWLHGCVRFVICATFSLTTYDSPMVFADLPKLSFNDLKLTATEVDEFVELANKRSRILGEFIRSPAVLHMITTTCDGHIGALTSSMLAMEKHFKNSGSMTVEDVTSFYMSSTVTQTFTRCFGYEPTAVPEAVRDVLLTCLIKKKASASVENFSERGDQESLKALLRGGVLVPTHDEGMVRFASPAAWRFVNSIMFPNRLAQELPPDLPTLMRRVIGRMSALALSTSLADRQHGFPPEALFQHLVMGGLQAEMPLQCSISSELSHLFPFEVTEEGHPTLDKVNIDGRIDFYIDRSVRWGIELLVSGSDIGEHLARVESGGKYYGLAMNDSIVVDFRGNLNGSVTNVTRHEKRMTVFFKLGDFRTCKVVMGMENEIVTIQLAN